MTPSVRRDLLQIARQLTVIALFWLAVLAFAAIVFMLAGCGAAPIRFQEALEHWAYTANHPLAPIEDTSIPTTRPILPEKWP